MIVLYGTVLAALLGLAFGSFLNVCLSRWPRGESIVAPPSHCMSCGRRLRWWENVPLVSWLALRGRCRTCRAWIGWRYPLVEAAVGLLWAAVAWNTISPSWIAGISSYDVPLLAQALVWMAFFWIVVALAVLDAEHLWLPDLLTLPGIVLGLLLAAVQPLFIMQLDPIIGSRWIESLGRMRFGLWTPLVEQIAAALAAAALILIIRWVYWLIRRREGVGLGDAKLMAMLAAWLGLPRALLSFGIGVVLGGLVGVAVLARAKGKDRALTKLPLGTFLCIGGIVSALWGRSLIVAYLRWCGF